MDDEDIISLQENESILKNMKKKDSKTVYLQTKGAFLSAIAVHESESDNNISNSLLSSEDSETVNSEENLIMDNNTKEEDILAVATELSQDLSNMASSKEEAKDEGQALEKEAIEESSEKEVAESNQEVEQISEQSEQQADDTVEQSSSSDSEESEVQNVDSEDPEELEEASTDKVDEVQEEVTQDSDLTTVQSSDEQDTAKLTTQVALLEEEISSLKDENSKLKSALHMTLVERVVDTKISLGLAEQSDRDGMIEAHASRTASSLADLLRDLASFSVKTGKRTKDFLTSNEFDVDNMVSFNEENVKTLDEEVIEKSNPADSFEQVLVDTLMGRRKL
jgi:hypothetical protein